MKRRIVMQIRLSKNWVKTYPEPAISLAMYLYSFYTFLGLADPTADFDWVIARDATTKHPYLMIFEDVPTPENEEEAEVDQFPFDSELDPDYLDQEFTEEELNPDIIKEDKDVKEAGPS